MIALGGLASLHAWIIFSVLTANAIGGQAPGSGELRSPGGVIRLKNFSRISSDLEKGETVLTGVGNPVSIDDTGTGLTLTAQSMSCTLHQNAKGEYVIDHATLSGDAHVVMDSRIAAQTKAIRAKLAKSPATENAPNSSVVHLDSDTVEYEAEKDETVLTFPKPVAYAESVEGKTTKVQAGKPIDVSFTQETHARGSNGRFTVASPVDPSNRELKPRTGHLGGPVKFNVHRVETPITLNGTAIAPTETKIDGVGDRLDADFLKSGEPTVTLEGNVRVDGDGTGFSGTVTGTRAILTLDRQSLRPKSYDFLGTPAKTVIKTLKTTGGSR